jgi:hypothetical protein
MKKFFRKTWVKVLCIVLACFTLGGAIFGIVKATDEQKTKKVVASWSIGGLDSNGKYKESDETIYTTKPIEALGLTITPKFNSDVSFKVFYYDRDYNFLYATEQMTETYTNNGSYPKYARVVVTPKEDESINVFEIVKYSRQLTLKNNKVQKYLYDKNLYEIDEDLYTLEKHYNGTVGGSIVAYIDNEGVDSHDTCSKLVEVGDAQKLVLFGTSTYAHVYFADGDQKIIAAPVFNFSTPTNDYFHEMVGSNHFVSFDIPEGTRYVGIVTGSHAQSEHFQMFMIG